MGKTKIFGRLLRLGLGIFLTIIVVPVYLKTNPGFILLSLLVTLALIIFYIILHLLVMRFMPGINRWLGALMAVLPVVAVLILGQGGGLIFGRGEGELGALTFLAISFFVDFIRSDAGCEVMAVPGLFFRNRTPLACIALTPIDMLENKFSREG